MKKIHLKIECSSYLAIIFLIFLWYMLAFPYFYEAGFNLPPKNKINYTEGILLSEKTSEKKGEIITLKQNNKIYYSCSLPSKGGHTTCYSELREPASVLQGRHVTIGWVDNPLNFFNEKSFSVVTISVEGVPFLTYETIEQDLENRRIFNFMAGGFLSLFFIATISLFIRKKK